MNTSREEQRDVDCFDRSINEGNNTIPHLSFSSSPCRCFCSIQFVLPPHFAVTRLGIRESKLTNEALVQCWFMKMPNYTRTCYLLLMNGVRGRVICVPVTASSLLLTSPLWRHNNVNWQGWTKRTECAEDVESLNHTRTALPAMRQTVTLDDVEINSSVVFFLLRRTIPFLLEFVWWIIRMHYTF